MLWSSTRPPSGAAKHGETNKHTRVDASKSDALSRLTVDVMSAVISLVSVRTERVSYSDGLRSKPRFPCGKRRFEIRLVFSACFLLFRSGYSLFRAVYVNTTVISGFRDRKKNNIRLAQYLLLFYPVFVPSLPPHPPLACRTVP